MGRIWKIFSVVIVLVVALAVGGVAVLKSTDFNSYRGLVAEQVKSFTGRQLAIAGNLKLRISLNPALTVEGLSLANAAWGTSPEMAKLKRLEAEVELLPLLSGEVKVKRIVLVGLEALLETDAKGRGNWIFDGKGSTGKAEPEQKSGGKATVPVVNMVRIKDATITYVDGISARRVVVRVESLDFTADGLNSPINLDFSGAYNDLAFVASARLGSLGTLLGGTDPFPVSARIRALGASVGIEGTIKNPRQVSGMNLKLVAELPDVAALAKAFDISMDNLPSLKFTTGLADIAGGYVFDSLKLTIGNSDLAGRVAILLDRRRPDVELVLTSGQIELDQLLTKGPAAKKADRKDDGRFFPDDPLAVDGLKAVNAKINFKGKRVDFRGMTISDISTRLVLRDGRLDITSLKAVLGKGTIDANILLDGAGKTPKVALKLDVRKLDYGALMGKLSAENVISGKVYLKADVKGAGKSVRAIMASLGGRLRGQIKGGKVESGMLDVLSADVLSALPFVDSKGNKDIRCAVADFDISSGLAKSRAIVFETAGLSMVGKGSVNLADETIKLKIDPSARNVSLMKLAMVPVNVGGTFASPSVTPDIGAAAVGVVTGAISTGTGIVSGVANAIGSVVGGERKSGDVDTTDYCKLAMAGKPLVRAGPSSVPPPRKKEKSTKEKSIIENIGGGIGGALKSIIGQ